MSPKAPRRRSISEKAFISIPVGIVALLLLIVIPLSLILYRRRSRRSRLVSGNPVDLVGEIPSMSRTSIVSQAMDRNKELPRTPQNAQFIIDIRADPYTSSHDDSLNRSTRSTRENRRVRPMTLPSSKRIENLANDHLQKASSLNMSTGSPSGPAVPSSSRNDLRVLNLTDEDMSFMNQLSTPRSPSSLKTLVEKQEQTCSKDCSCGSGMEKNSSKLAGSSKKTRIGSERSRNTFHGPFVKKNPKEHRLSTPTLLPAGKATRNDRNDTKVVQDLAPKYDVQSQLQTSKLAINIPMYPIYLDPSQRSAFCDMMPEKGPETALPPYSSPGNGHPFRLSMFI